MRIPNRITIVAVLAAAALPLGGCAALITPEGPPTPVAAPITASTPGATAPIEAPVTDAPADRFVPGTVAAKAMVTVKAYTWYGGSVDKACAKVVRKDFLQQAAGFNITEADALDGLRSICKSAAHQKVDKAAAANDLLAIMIHDANLGMSVVCQPANRNELAASAAKLMAGKGYKELTKGLFLTQLATNCDR